jgi:hypothetical protein
MNFYLEYKRINELMNFYNKTNNKLMKLDGSIQLITNINNQLLKADMNSTNINNQLLKADMDSTNMDKTDKSNIHKTDKSNIHKTDKSNIHKTDKSNIQQIEELKNNYIIMKKNYQDSLDKLATEVVEKDLIIQKLNDEIDNMTKLSVLDK